MTTLTEAIDYQSDSPAVIIPGGGPHFSYTQFRNLVSDVQQQLGALGGGGELVIDHDQTRLRQRREQVPCGCVLAAHDFGNVGGDVLVGRPRGGEMGWCHG